MRGLIATPMGDTLREKAMPANKQVHYVDPIVGGQRRVVRSTPSADINALVDGIEQLLVPQVTRHQIHRGTQHRAEEIAGEFGIGNLHAFSH